MNAIFVSVCSLVFMMQSQAYAWNEKAQYGQPPKRKTEQVQVRENENWRPKPSSLIPASTFSWKEKSKYGQRPKKRVQPVETIAVTPWHDDFPASFSKDDIEIILSRFTASQRTGHLTVMDTHLNKARRMTLIQIHSERMLKLDPFTVSVCTDFRDQNGEPVDVDFHILGKNNTYQVTHVYIHKVREEEQLTYLIQGNGFWKKVDVVRIQPALNKNIIRNLTAH